jgi:hypothetical protein
LHFGQTQGALEPIGSWEALEGTEVCFPFTAAIIETTKHRTHPLQAGIHTVVLKGFGGGIQKLGSTIAERISSELIMRGTYQTLFGFCRIMKKQAAAAKSSKRKMADIPTSSNECTNPSTTN